MTTKYLFGSYYTLKKLLTNNYVCVLVTLAQKRRENKVEKERSLDLRLPIRCRFVIEETGNRKMFVMKKGSSCWFLMV